MSLCVIQSCIVFILPGCWRKQFQQSELCWFPSSAKLAIISGYPFFSQVNLWSHPLWAQNIPVCSIVDVGDRSEKVDTISSRVKIQLFLEAPIPFSIYLYINRVKNTSIPHSKKMGCKFCSTCPRASSPSDDTGGTRRIADLFRNQYATACHTSSSDSREQKVQRGSSLLSQGSSQLL